MSIISSGKFLNQDSILDNSLLNILLCGYKERNSKILTLINGNISEISGITETLLNDQSCEEIDRSKDIMYQFKATSIDKSEQTDVYLFNAKKIQEKGADIIQESFHNVAISFSDFFMFNFHWSELIESTFYADSKIKSFFKKLKKLTETSSKIGDSKKTIIIIINDFITEKNNKSELEQTLDTKIGDIKKEIQKYNLKNINIEFIKLPPYSIKSEKFINLFLQTDFYKLFSFSKNENNLFLNCSIEEISGFIEKISKDNNLNQIESSAVIKETVASISTTKIFEEVMQKFENAISIWDSCTEDGSLIQNLGKESVELFNESLISFEKKALIYSTTKAYATKLEILENEMLSKLEDLFFRQVQKLKELCFQSFKDSLGAILVNSNVDSEIKAAVKITEKYYKSKKENLRPKINKFESNDTKDTFELSSRIREMATERVQAARLQGVYLQKNKHPISLSFHFLHPHPFGKDSRFDTMSMNDTMNYNPDLSKRAGLMRQFANENSGMKQSLDQPELKDRQEVDLIYREEPSKSFQNNS